MVVLALVLAGAGLALLLGGEEGEPIPTGEGPAAPAEGPAGPRVTFDDDRPVEGESPSPLGAPPEEQPLATSSGGDAAGGSASVVPDAEAGKIRGRVQDPDGAPIYMASVVASAKPPKPVKDEADEKLQVLLDRVEGNETLRKRILERYKKLRRKRRRAAGKSFSTTTDSQGEFVLPGVPSGGQLRVSARGFMPRVVPLGSKPDGTVVIELVPSRTLRILVVEAESGLPIEKALVKVKMGAVRENRTTDKKGELVLTVGTESVTLDVWKEKRVSKVWHGSDNMVIALELGRGVKGVVVHPDGTTLPVAPVVIVGKSQRRWPQVVKTDAEGLFELESGIKPGERIAVYSWDEEFSSRLIPDWLPAGSDNIRVQTELRGGAVIAGNGGPEEGMSLVAWQTAARQAPANPREVEAWDGHVQFSRLAAGRYRIRGSDERWYGKSFDVEPGQITHVRWVADPNKPGGVRQSRPGKPGAAADAPADAGQPPPPTAALHATVDPPQPVDVTLRLGSRAVRRLSSDDDGKFTLEKLPYGDYSLEVKRRDGQTFLLDVRLPSGEERLRIPIAD